METRRPPSLAPMVPSTTTPPSRPPNDAHAFRASVARAGYLPPGRTSRRQRPNPRARNASPNDARRTKGKQRSRAPRPPGRAAKLGSRAGVPALYLRRTKKHKSFGCSTASLVSPPKTDTDALRSAQPTCRASERMFFSVQQLHSCVQPPRLPAPKGETGRTSTRLTTPSHFLRRLATTGPRSSEERIRVLARPRLTERRAPRFPFEASPPPPPYPSDSSPPPPACTRASPAQRRVPPVSHRLRQAHRRGQIFVGESPPPAASFSSLDRAATAARPASASGLNHFASRPCSIASAMRRRISAFCAARSRSACALKFRDSRRTLARASSISRRGAPWRPGRDACCSRCVVASPRSSPPNPAPSAP